MTTPPLPHNTPFSLSHIGKVLGVIGSLFLLGSCLSCVSSHQRGGSQRGVLTVGQAYHLLSRTTVGFISTVPKNVWRSGSQYTLPFCTGWFIGPRTLVSAAHCFSETAVLNTPGGPIDIPVGTARVGSTTWFVRTGQQRMDTRSIQGDVGIATISDVNLAQDLVVLRVHRRTSPATTWLSLPRRDPEPGDRVYGFGNTSVVTAFFAQGEVARVSRGEGLVDMGLPGGWIHVNISLAPGSSGGPVINTRGEVIGVVDRIANRLPTLTFLSPWWSVQTLDLGPRR